MEEKGKWREMEESKCVQAEPAGYSCASSGRKRAGLCVVRKCKVGAGLKREILE